MVTCFGRDGFREASKESVHSGDGSTGRGHPRKNETLCGKICLVHTVF